MRASWRFLAPSLLLPAARIGILLAAFAPAACAPWQTGSLYQRLGAQTGIERFVGDAVDLWMRDERIAADFDNINPVRLKSRLRDQICQLAGGPCLYRGRSMAASHAALGLTRAKFNAVAEDLQIAMEQAGVPYPAQNSLLALLAPMERDVVTR